MLVDGSTPHPSVKHHGASQQTEISSVQDQGMTFPNCDKGDIHDPRTRSRIDGIKVMARGISEGKQVMKFANTSNRGRVCLFYRNERTISCKMYIYPVCQGLRHYCLP